MSVKIGVIGCGAWGTTLAKVLAENNHEVMIWCHRQALADSINTFNKQPKALPTITLPTSIKASTNINQVAHFGDAFVNGLASSFLFHYETFSTVLAGKPVLSLTKGLMKEGESLFVSDYLNRILPNSELALLSGPNLALEIANKKPAAAVISSKNEEVATYYQALISNQYFRAYTLTDLTGVEIGGVLKNIMAIGAGCVDGLELGENAKAALITRGLQEMIRFGQSYGASKETFYGLSGIGDLIATCHSSQSRNWRVGQALAKNESLENILKELNAVAEGVNTTRIVAKIAKEKNIEMPITLTLNDVLFNQLDPREGLSLLMNRNLKSES